jgi:hypothetical protein
MFHGLGSCTPSSVAKRTEPGRHTFDTLKGPSQLGRACGAPLGLGFTARLGPRPEAPYYARTVDGNAGALGYTVHFGLLLAIFAHRRGLHLDGATAPIIPHQKLGLVASP